MQWPFGQALDGRNGGNTKGASLWLTKKLNKKIKKNILKYFD
jgi:hypothetical protein